jgi:rod shape-determining protein MreC
MDTPFSRYRNLTVLLALIVAQLVLLGYQVRTNQNVRLLRVWSVSAVTPLAELAEAVRSHTFGVFGDYFVLLGVKDENQRLREQVGALKMENLFLRTQLADADRARALQAFQAETPSRTIAARVIANGTGANSATVFVDRGSSSGVESGMAVVTPEGIVGKVVAAYPGASLVLLATDPTFAAGVVSQKNHVSGTLKGMGHGTTMVDYIQNEQKVDIGEWFYTSGYDRVFPRGFPVGQVTVARNSPNGKQVFLNLSGLQGMPDEVLIVLQGVHGKIPENPPPSPGVHLMPLPEEAGSLPGPGAAPAGPPPLATPADELREVYQRIGQVENHQYGTAGSIPNFNAKAPAQPSPTPAAAARPPAQQAAGAAAVKPSTAPPASVAKPSTLAVKPNPLNKPPATVAKKPNTAPEKFTAPLLIPDPADADPGAADPSTQSPKPAPPGPRPQ